LPCHASENPPLPCQNTFQPYPQFLLKNQTLSGELTIPQACAQLGIHETRFHVQRAETLQAALGFLEPRAAGRPSHVLSAEAQRIAELEAQLGELQLDLKAAQIRLEHAQILRGDRAAGSSKKPKRPC
jgi:hypothetical protein